MLKLKYKKKYLKYKNNYLHIKSQIGGSESYLWYNDRDEGKFTYVFIDEKENQDLITKAYLSYLWDKIAIETDRLSIKGPLDVSFWHHKLKFVEYDDKYLKEVIKRFTLLKCMKHMEEILFNSFNFVNIDLLSIGCENDHFEKLCEKIFGVPISCFKLEDFENNLEIYHKSKIKKQHSILLCVSSNSEKAIRKLKPLALLKIDNFELFVDEFLLTDTTFSIENQQYIKILQVIQRGPKAAISLWINCTLYDFYVETFRSNFYKGYTRTLIERKKKELKI